MSGRGSRDATTRNDKMTKAMKKIVEAAETEARNAYIAGDYAKASASYAHVSRMYDVEYRMSGKRNMLEAASGCAEMASKMAAL